MQTNLILTIVSFLLLNGPAKAEIYPGAFDKLESLFESQKGKYSANQFAQDIAKAKGCAYAPQHSRNELHPHPAFIVVQRQAPGMGPEFPPIIKRGFSVEGAAIGQDGFFATYSERETEHGLTFSYNYTIRKCDFDIDEMREECTDTLETDNIEVRSSGKYISFSRVAIGGIGYCWLDQ